MPGGARFEEKGGYGRIRKMRYPHGFYLMQGIHNDGLGVKNNAKYKVKELCPVTLPAAI